MNGCLICDRPWVGSMSCKGHRESEFHVVAVPSLRACNVQMLLKMTFTLKIDGAIFKKFLHIRNQHPRKPRVSDIFSLTSPLYRMLTLRYKLLGYCNVIIKSLF